MEPEPERFRGPDGTGEPAYLLRRVGPGRYALAEQFSYLDPKHDTRFTIPADGVDFTTDLGSIPRWFTWLIPGTGRHLPAMLVHDALVLGLGEEKTYGGDTVSRLEADRILRDAMKHLGTKRLRRWLVWTATAFATAQSCRQPRRLWRWLPVAWVVFLIAIGVLMSLYMLFDFTYGVLPDDRSTFDRGAIGVAGAIVVPLPVSLLVWRGQPESALIGIIGGWAIAWLLWPMALVLAAYGPYVVLEAFASRNEPKHPKPPPRPLPPGLDPEEARAAACEGRSPGGA